ncbi:hypothetical protein HanRHA438_Chr11g0499421 [Helianthus annuus]|uniref:Uncharacterized protein n=1 Tax=Helianthus annuus TaxID=4232 RepID=A0A1Y3BV29_HELAN|nr:hypothetical protein HanHA300_Chr11g0398921 [Helianthus annuus]KAJ0509022.1 hypothetical protein HanIR_Chr11g0523951 [Helianthus annuus]KAJ0517172.1 hypothetical protein HanHA89_Chr11g0422241 [Helianthus annuus]KAJ0685180.1 hypothetical protein HanLR1_Chr11g0399661 [Helianthus annuus]KAJ0689092.1 hypothetical protein HanOQP8_Chr11g0401701 [Helianthus annuus]
MSQSRAFFPIFFLAVSPNFHRLLIRPCFMVHLDSQTFPEWNRIGRGAISGLFSSATTFFERGFPLGL